MINKIKLLGYLDTLENNEAAILATIDLVTLMAIYPTIWIVPIVLVVSLIVLIIFSVLQTYKSILRTTRADAIKSIRKLF
jgi:hypothetical protein